MRGEKFKNNYQWPEITVSGYEPFKGKQGRLVPGGRPFDVDVCKELVSFIKGDYRSLVEGIYNEPDKDKRSALKAEKLKAISFSAQVQKWRSVKNIKKHSGLLVIDIDASDNEHLSLETTTDWQKLKGKLFKHPNVVAAFLSPSWQGVKLLVKIEASVENHRENFYSFQWELRRTYNVNIDTKCLDEVRLCFATYDPEGKIKPNFFDVPVYQIAPGYLKHKKETEKVYKSISHVDLSKITGSDWIQTAKNYASSQGMSFTDGQKHMYLFYFCIAANCLGIPKEEANTVIDNEFLIPSGTKRNSNFDEPLNDAQYFGIWAKKRQNTVKPDKELRYNKYFGEIAEECVQLIEKEDRLIFQADTGAGKSHAFVKEICPQLDGRSVILVPTRAVARQLSKKYDIPVIMGGSSDEEAINVARAAKVTVCVYNSFPKVSTYFNNVIIDESHTTTSQYSIKKEAAKEMQRSFSIAEKVALISATPDLLFLEDGFKLVSAAKSQVDSKEIFAIKTEAKPEESVLKHVDKHSKDNTLLVFKLQDKILIDSIKSILLEKGFKDEQVVSIYRDENTENDSDFNLLIQEERFRKDVKIVLSTSIINEGVSIYEPFGRSVHMVDIETEFYTHICDKIQFINRFRMDDKSRLPAEVKFFSYHRISKSEREILDLDLKWTYKNSVEKAKLSCKALEHAYPDHLHDGNSLETTFSDDVKFTLYNDYLGRYEPNYFAIKHAKNDQYRFHRDVEKFYQELQEAHPQYTVTWLKDDEEISEGDIKELERIQVVERMNRHSAQNNIYNAIKRSESGFLEAIYHHSQDSSLRKSLRIEYGFCRRQSEAAKEFREVYKINFEKYSSDLNTFAKRFVSFKKLNLKTSEILYLLFEKDEDGINYKFRGAKTITRAQDDLKINLLLYIHSIDQKLLSRQEARDIKEYFKIRKAFKIGETYTKDEVNSVFDVVQKRKHNRYGKQKELDLFKILFFIKDDGFTDDRHKRYKIESVRTLERCCKSYLIDFKSLKCSLEKVLKTRQQLVKINRNSLKDNELSNIRCNSIFLYKDTATNVEKEDFLPEPDELSLFVSKHLKSHF